MRDAYTEQHIAWVRFCWALRRYHPMVRWPYKLVRWLTRKLEDTP